MALLAGVVVASCSEGSMSCVAVPSASRLTAASSCFTVRVSAFIWRCSLLISERAAFSWNWRLRTSSRVEASSFFSAASSIRVVGLPVVRGPA